MNIYLLILVILISLSDLFRTSILISKERLITNWKDYLLFLCILIPVPILIFETGYLLQSLIQNIFPAKILFSYILLIFIGIKIAIYGFSNRQPVVSRDIKNVKSLFLMAFIISFNPFLAGITLAFWPGLFVLSFLSILILCCFLIIGGMVFSNYLQWFLKKQFPITIGLLLIALIIIEIIKQIV